MPKFDGYSYYVHEYDETDDRDDDLKSSVKTAIPKFEINPAPHNIDDLLDEVLDSDDDPDEQMLENQLDAMATDVDEKLAASANVVGEMDTSEGNKKSTADELSAEKQEFVDLFTTGKYGLEPDALYDESADEEDESYVKAHNLAKVAKSDAVLSCGRCFAVVCVDCQRHVKYENQFRAMFVLEGRTEILPDKVIKYRKKELTQGGKRKAISKVKAQDQPTSPPNKNKSKKSAANPTVLTTSTNETPTLPEQEIEEGDFGDPTLYDHYFQVICEACKAEIAVYDREEVYHFYNVVV